VHVIPESPVRGGGAIDTAPATPLAEPAGRSVLVVDDSRFVRASLVRGLSGHFPLRQADSGEHAWELLLQDESVGAVLSDLSMPGMDGFELLQRVRGSALERIRRMPFAVLSGADDAAHRERARADGADRFVLKGGGVDELLDWVRSAWRDAEAPPAGPPDHRLEPPQALPAAGPPAFDAPAPAPEALPDWLRRTVAGGSPGTAAPVLIRVHAAGADGLPQRLRRGVRSEPALYVAGPHTAWLCVPATAPLAVRLALRLGLLAAGRPDPAQPHEPVVQVGIRAVPLDDPLAAIERLDAAAAVLRRPDPGLHLAGGPESAGSGWECRLPWGLVRLLLS